MRSKFAEILTQPLKIQLIMKGIVSDAEWRDQLEDKIRYVWNENSYWAESKELALLERRVEMLDKVENYKGKYFTEEYINKKVLRRTDDEIADVKKQIEEYNKENAENKPVDDNSNENGEQYE